MEIIKKLQKKPEQEKKIILWSVIIVVALILFVLWILGSKRTIESFEKQQVIEGVKLPEIEMMEDDMSEEEFLQLLEQLDEERTEAE